MNMNTIDILLLFDVMNSKPTPPPGDDFWIDNLDNKIITNTGQFIVFNPGT